MKNKVKEKLNEVTAIVKETMEKHNCVTGLWFEFKNMPLEDMREVAKEQQQELKFCERESCMQLQLSFYHRAATIFIYSTKIKVQTHYVEDTAIKNI